MDASTSPATPNDHQPPFPRDDLHRDIVQIFWLHLRATTLFVGDQNVSSLLSGSDQQRGGIHGFWNLDEGPENFEIGFDHVAGSTFARCLEMQYDLAYRGVITNLAHHMEMDSEHTWVALYLHDLLSSHVAEEVDAWTGPSLTKAIQRCHQTSELANARLALEGREIFCYFSTPKSGDRDDSAALEGLTIRQMALLSGMEEMSVRTAISRKGPNQLPSYKEDGRTLVRSEDARNWLKAKGKYIPIRREWSGRQLRLEKTRFANLSEFDEALKQQVLYLSGVAGASPEELKARLSSICLAHGHSDTFGLTTYSMAKDASLMAALAEALSLPAKLLALRAQQAQLSNELQLLDIAISKAEDDPEPQSPETDSAAG